MAKNSPKKTVKDREDYIPEIIHYHSGPVPYYGKKKLSQMICCQVLDVSGHGFGYLARLRDCDY